MLSHNKGNRFRVILQTLQDELGYETHYKVIDGMHFVPQHRERILIVGFQQQTNFSWDNLHLLEKVENKLSAILHPQNGRESPEEPYTVGKNGVVNAKYTSSEKLWSYLQTNAAKHCPAGRVSGLTDEDSVVGTLPARYDKDGSEILIFQGDKEDHAD